MQGCHNVHSRGNTRPTRPCPIGQPQYSACSSASPSGLATQIPHRPPLCVPVRWRWRRGEILVRHSKTMPLLFGRSKCNLSQFDRNIYNVFYYYISPSYPLLPIVKSTTRPGRSSQQYGRVLGDAAAAVDSAPSLYLSPSINLHLSLSSLFFSFMAF